MKRIKVFVVGSAGKMGLELLSLIAEQDQFEFVGGLDRFKSKGNPKVVSNFHQISEKKKIDVVIDFSSPVLVPKVTRWCEKRSLPLVCGTTGLGRLEVLALKKASQKNAVFWAPNMSLGIALMNKMMEVFEKAHEMDFQIEEVHHKRKRDCPSGTAIFLQKTLQRVVEKSVAKTIPKPLGVRGGGVFGTHRVLALGEEETLIIEHCALNRRVFARGALRAGEWIINQKPGYYSFHDLLGVF